LLVHTEDAEHDAFNRVISSVAIAQMLLTILAALAAREWRKRNRELWWSLFVWAVACGIFMFAITNPLWNVLPKLRFMQFPWRWMLCMGIPFTLLTAFGVQRWMARAGLYLAAIAVIAFAWHHYQAPWWDTQADLREMQDNMLTGGGYEGTDEYTPAGADPSAVDKSARFVTVDGPARGAIHVLEWAPERKRLTADTSAADRLALHLFFYPAWRVEVNGRMVQAEAREGTGQMLVPVEAGMNRVQIIFVRTWDRTLGAWLSLVATVFVLISLRKPPRLLAASR
jgi:hypothetical protein